MNIPSLIKRFSPVFYLHPEERFMPAHPIYYISHCKLVSNDGVVLEDTGKIDVSKLHLKTPNSHLTLDGEAFDKVMIRYGQLPFNRVPIFCHAVHEFPTNPKSPQHIIKLRYVLFFCFNGDYNILESALVGQHDSDLEHITVDVDAQSQEIWRIHYGRHGSSEGQWVPKDQFFVEDETHPVVFIALNGHGCYHKEGVHLRLLGLANDVTQKGPRWFPSAIQVHEPESPEANRMSESTNWFFYSGNWMETGISGIPRKHWFAPPYDELGRRSPQIYFNQSVYKLFSFVWTGAFLFLLTAYIVSISRAKETNPFYLSGVIMASLFGVERIFKFIVSVAAFRFA